MIPWEGMSDYYRDRCRHGGILSNTFIDFWWNRQVGPRHLRLLASNILLFGAGDRKSVRPAAASELGSGHD